MKNNKRGFTLIELLVVIAIIGLLSTLAVVSLNSARQKARDARRQSDIKQISTAMELYMSQVDSYPTYVGADCTGSVTGRIAAGSGLQTVCYGTPISDAQSNTYLQAIPTDPQTGTTEYQYSGDGTSYCIMATLEENGGTGHFVCRNGSCLKTTTDVCS